MSSLPTTPVETPVRSYPVDYCLMSRGAMGACILWPAHEGLCRDAHDHTFVGYPVTTMAEYKASQEAPKRSYATPEWATRGLRTF